MNIGFKKNDKILIMDPISKYFINKFSKVIEIQYIPKSKFKITKWNVDVYDNSLLLNHIKKEKIKYAFVPLTIEYNLVYYLKNLFQGTKSKIMKKKSSINPLFNKITTEELKRFCRYKNMRYSLPDNKIFKFLDDLEKKYPGTKFSFNHAIN